MSDMSAEAVAYYLRTLRGAADLTQEEAAVKGGISAKTLGRWEKGDGKHEPTVTPLKRLVKALGGSTKDALMLLITEDSTWKDGEEIAYAWLQMSDDQRSQVDSVIETTMSEDLLEIIQELRDHYRDDRTLVAFLRGALLGGLARDARRSPASDRSQSE